MFEKHKCLVVKNSHNNFFTFKVVVKKEPETDTDHETDTDRNSNPTPPLPSQPTDADLQATPVGNPSESQGK